MFRKATVALVVWCVLASACACGQGKGAASLGYKATSEEFFSALLEARFADAKAMALPDFADRVGDDVDRFAALLQKYEFRERKIVSARPWGQTGNPEGDLTVEIGYQFRGKEPGESWGVGLLHLRVRNEGGRWGIAGVRYIVPK